MTDIAHFPRPGQNYPYIPSSVNIKLPAKDNVDNEIVFNSVCRKSETFITVQPDFGQYIVKLKYRNSQKE